MKFSLDTFDFDQIPKEEDEYYEFKSGRLANDLDLLQRKIYKAVSGFANSGGGYLIIGIDDKTGEVDGGVIPFVGKKGRQSISDWIDQVIDKIEPNPSYNTMIIRTISERGKLNEGHIIVVIAVKESCIGPHMAPDHIYYIRAGAHTVPARHFVVEAIRAKRFYSKPQLSHTFRLKPTNDQVLQLGVISISDSPAINIKINLDPLPELLNKLGSEFPIQPASIDRNHPFYFDVALYADCLKTFGNNILLELEYQDILQNQYVFRKRIGVEGVIPLNIGANEIKKALEGIEKALNTSSKKL